MNTIDKKIIDSGDTSVCPVCGELSNWYTTGLDGWIILRRCKKFTCLNKKCNAKWKVILK